jgi:hypothetical protein
LSAWFKGWLDCRDGSCLADERAARRCVAAVRRFLSLPARCAGAAGRFAGAAPAAAGTLARELPVEAEQSEGGDQSQDAVDNDVLPHDRDLLGFGTPTRAGAVEAELMKLKFVVK